jgi:hypothetical protein
VDCPQRVSEQFMNSLQNPSGGGIPPAVLSSPLEGQTRFELVDFFFAAHKLTVNEYSLCTCSRLG